MLYEILQTTLFVNHEQIFAKTKYLNVYILFVTLNEFINTDAIDMQVLTLHLASAVFPPMISQWISWTEYFSTRGTWNWYAFQVICLNMFFYKSPPALFSANFANES